MHRLFQLPLFFGILFFGACKPSRMHSSGPFTGKLLTGVCSQYMVQLVSGDLDPSKYVAAWEHPVNHKIYHNVFAIRNECYFGTTNVNIGDVFQFTVEADSARENCVVCFIYEPTPPVSNTVKVIQTIK